MLLVIVKVDAPVVVIVVNNSDAARAPQQKTVCNLSYQRHADPEQVINGATFA